MLCDFFYPNFGGVENHIYYLSQCLIAAGHKVVIVTHTYEDRQGIRWLSKNRLKVYYLPFANMALQTTYPTLWFSLPLYYDIYQREGVDLVHGHSAFSTMCQEGIIHARTMGIPCVFTDHSLFGFADISSILTNKILKFCLSDVARVICVSHTSRENTLLRAALQPENVYVIPNAILPDQFYPSAAEVGQNPKNPERIVVVVLSRLVYRKGMDLLIEVIPEICKRFPFVDFLIAGDGPKKAELEQMRERLELIDRVKMIGAVSASQARSVLIQGQIFLNTSLTEAFCMAILEAAACGLYVVSTAVGGIPEVLPDEMISLAAPNSAELTAKLASAIENYRAKSINTRSQHAQVAEMYSWTDVTQRTLFVYHSIQPADQDTPLIERLRRVWGTGVIAGKFLCIILIWNHFFLHCLQFIRPPSYIDPAFGSVKNKGR